MKKRILTLLLSIALPLSVLALGTTGKLTGTVLDKESREPLAGALIDLQGTTRKVVTDITGKFTFINLPVGAYTLDVSLFAYASVKIEGVMVSADLTTVQDVELPPLTALAKELVVTAQRPLIDQTATTKFLVFTSEKINSVPLRGVRQIVGLSPGVVQNERDDDKIYMRGGRSGEVAFYVDGILQNSPIDYTFSGEISNSSLQEIVIESSYDAQYGNAASGIINASTKNPSADRYAARAEVITDGFIPEDEKRLGLTGYGYNLYNLSLSGPVIPGNNALSFYGLVERQNLADAVPTEGFGVRPGAELKLWNGVWKLRYDPEQSFKIDIGGNYTSSSQRYFSLQRGYEEYAVERRDESGELLGYDFVKANSSENGWRDETRVLQLYTRYTQPLGSSAYLTVQGHYSSTETEVGDNLYWRDFDKYQENGAIGQDAFGLVNLPGNPFNAYWKESVEFYELRADFESQMGSHNLKTGGQFRYHSYKLVEFVPEVSRDNDTQVNLIGYSPEDIGYAPFTQFYKDNPDLIKSETDGVRHPVIASFYVRDLIEFKNFYLNAGLRFDYLDANTLAIRDLNNPFIPGTTEIDYEKNKTSLVVQPRVSFAFPIADETVLHVMYGKFAQMPPLQYMYASDYQMQRRMQGGQGVRDLSAPNPNLEPEIMTSYELGVRQALGDFASLDVTLFYKEIRNLIQTAFFDASADGSVPARFSYDNADFGTVKGLEVSLSSRRIGNLGISASYTLQFASGTNSNATDLYEFYRRFNPDESGQLASSFTPKAVQPLNFDQRHRGNINLDYRIAQSDLTVPEFLRGVGINALFTFNSGHAYTPYLAIYDPVSSDQTAPTVASAARNTAYTDWSTRLDIRIDKQFRLFDRLDMTVYLWAINVLGTKNSVEVYPTTGSADSGGFADTEAFQQRIDGFLNQIQNPVLREEQREIVNQKYREMYGFQESNPDHYGIARQIRLGIVMAF